MSDEPPRGAVAPADGAARLRQCDHPVPPETSTAVG